jgi:hypothetical protein
MLQAFSHGSTADAGQAPHFWRCAEDPDLGSVRPDMVSARGALAAGPAPSHTSTGDLSELDLDVRDLPSVHQAPASLRWALCAGPWPGLPLPRAADGRLVLGVDVSPWLRTDPATSPGRLLALPYLRPRTRAHTGSSRYKTANVTPTSRLGSRHFGTLTQILTSLLPSARCPDSRGTPAKATSGSEATACRTRPDRARGVPLAALLVGVWGPAHHLRRPLPQLCGGNRQQRQVHRWEQSSSLGVASRAGFAARSIPGSASCPFVGTRK